MQRLLVGLCLCFVLFGVLRQVDANEHTSVDEKIEDFLRSKGLEMGINAKKGRIITKGYGETKVDAICEALGELNMLVGYSLKMSAGSTESNWTITTESNRTLIDGLKVAIQKRSESSEQSEKIKVATRIQFSDDNNHERVMTLNCDYKSRSQELVKESGEIMIEEVTETRSDVQIIGSLHGILDTLKEKRLFSIWFASDDLRELAVLMIIDTRKD